MATPPGQYFYEVLVSVVWTVENARKKLERKKKGKGGREREGTETTVNT